jgi:hypothetical protein
MPKNVTLVPTHTHRPLQQCNTRLTKFNLSLHLAKSVQFNIHTLSLANFSFVGDRTFPRMHFELANILSLTSLTEEGERSLLSPESLLLTSGRDSLNLRPEFCRVTFEVGVPPLLLSLSPVPSESADPDLYVRKH